MFKKVEAYNRINSYQEEYVYFYWEYSYISVRAELDV